MRPAAMRAVSVSACLQFRQGINCAMAQPAAKVAAVQPASVCGVPREIRSCALTVVESCCGEHLCLCQQAGVSCLELSLCVAAVLYYVPSIRHNRELWWLPAQAVVSCI